MRSDEVSVLVGFHSANGCSHSGSVAVATNAFDTNVIGNSTVYATCWATSTVGTDRPSHDPSQAIANANSRHSPKPAISSGMPVRTVQPTTRPEIIRTIRIPPL